MSSVEDNHEDWVEIRARVDSISSGVFLVAGGALTLSISAIFNFKTSNHAFPLSLIETATWSWRLLLASMLIFIVLKAHLIGQSYLRGTMPAEKFNRIVNRTNYLGWTIGVLGLAFFVSGMFLIINVATGVISA